MTNASVTVPVSTASSTAVAPPSLYVGPNRDFAPYRPPTVPRLGWRVAVGPPVALTVVTTSASSAATAPTTAAGTGVTAVPPAASASAATNTVSATAGLAVTPIPASASAAAVTPRLTCTVRPELASASAAGVDPSAGWGYRVTADVAGASAVTVNPTAAETVDAASADAAGIVPTLTVSVTPELATSDAVGVDPSLYVGEDLFPVTVTGLAGADAAAVAPVAALTATASYPPTATADAAAVAPTTGYGVGVTPGVATASSAGVAPTPGYGFGVTPTVASASAAAIAPTTLVSGFTTASAVITGVGSGYNYDVVFTPDGSKAYINNTASKTLIVMNASTNTVSSTISYGGSSPGGMAISPDGSKIYVPNYRQYFDVPGDDPTYGQGFGQLDIVSTSTDTVTGTIKLAIDAGPVEVAFSPDGTKAYVLGCPASAISVINVATDTVSDTITGLPNNFRGIWVSPDGTKLFITQYTTATDGTVRVVNTATKAITSISVGGFPDRLEVTPDGTKLYVALNNGTVSVVNTSTNTVTTTISVGSYNYDVAVSSDGVWVYATNYSSNTVSVINAATNTVAQTITVTGGPGVIAISPLGTKAYVVNDNNTVTVLT